MKRQGGNHLEYNEKNGMRFIPKNAFTRKPINCSQFQMIHEHQGERGPNQRDSEVDLDPPFASFFLLAPHVPLCHRTFAYAVSSWQVLASVCSPYSGLGLNDALWERSSTTTVFNATFFSVFSPVPSILLTLTYFLQSIFTT